MAAPRPEDLLFPYQLDWVDDASRFKLGCQGRGTGKSYQFAFEAVRDVWRAESEGHKDRWILSAPSERQSLLLLDKAKMWMDVFQLHVEDVIEERLGATDQALLKSSEIIFPGGSKIIAYPGKADNLRGEDGNIGLEEFAFFEDPERMWRGMFPIIRGNHKARIISSVNGKSGIGKMFYELVRDYYLEPERSAAKKYKWSVHFIDIVTAVSRGLKYGGEAPDLAELREMMNDPDGWAQEYMCEFLDTASVLLPYDLIALAESVEASEQCDPVWWQAPRRRVLGLDFGRSQDPTVCWTLELVGDLLITREVLVLRNMSTQEQADVLRHRIAASSRLCMDAAGPGTGLADLLADEHGEYDPKRDAFGKVERCHNTGGSFSLEIMPRLKAKFEAPTKLRIPISTEIREDLHEMQQRVSTTGRYSYGSPRTSEGHSDRCVALALAVRAASLGVVGEFAYERPRFLDRMWSGLGFGRKNRTGGMLG